MDVGHDRQHERPRAVAELERHVVDEEEERLGLRRRAVPPDRDRRADVVLERRRRVVVLAAAVERADLAGGLAGDLQRERLVVELRARRLLSMLQDVSLNPSRLRVSLFFERRPQGARGKN